MEAVYSALLPTYHCGLRQQMSSFSRTAVAWVRYLLQTWMYICLPFCWSCSALRLAGPSPKRPCQLLVNLVLPGEFWVGTVQGIRSVKEEEWVPCQNVRWPVTVTAMYRCYCRIGHSALCIEDWKSISESVFWSFFEEYILLCAVTLTKKTNTFWTHITYSWWLAI
jgi:hypothetical protein